MPQADSAKQRLQYVIQNVETRIENANSELENFANALKEDPANALTWSEKAFAAAAAKTVYGEALPVLRKPGAEQKLAAFRDFYMEETVRNAKYPATSTSQQSNLMHVQRGAALADLFEILSIYSKEV